MIATAPAFFATPATVTEVARTRTVVLLIGGYDGSGNYGDIAQLDAAVGLLERLDPDLLLLPVLERSRLVDHRALGEDFPHPSDRALFFDPGEGHEDDLLPVPAPADLAFAVCYLYGGGYLNPSWGNRKLAMLRSAETLFAGGGATKVCRLSSGLQVDADWVAKLSAADAEALRSFELLGVRDRGSGDALAAFGSGSPILDTADDAVGILRRLPPPDPRLNSDGRLHVNLHLAEHGWVTERPDAMASFYGDLVAELGRCAGLPVVALPLIAYFDRHFSDRFAAERLAEACTARGVELAEPRVLRPANLVDALAEMRQAALTVSCSYHVALTSLLLEVPAVLLRDNAYYEQKAAGLAEAFYLPSSFALNSHADPESSAREIAGIVLDEQRAATVRYQLALGASRVRERRANAEVELLARLGAASANALSSRIGEISTRLRERSAEPAELLAKLSLLQSENGTPLPPREASDTPEHEATQAMLAEVMESRSWQMTSPLRRIGARLRRM